MLFISNYLKCHDKFSEELYKYNVEELLLESMCVHYQYNTLRSIKHNIEKN